MFRPFILTLTSLLSNSSLSFSLPPLSSITWSSLAVEEGEGRRGRYTGGGGGGHWEESGRQGADG